MSPELWQVDVETNTATSWARGTVRTTGSSAGTRAPAPRHRPASRIGWCQRKAHAAARKSLLGYSTPNSSNSTGKPLELSIVTVPQAQLNIQEREAGIV